MTEKELMEYSLDRLLNILYMNIRLLEHYVVRDVLYYNLIVYFNIP